jgi:hypothetical protein
MISKEYLYMKKVKNVTIELSFIRCRKHKIPNRGCPICFQLYAKKYWGERDYDLKFKDLNLIDHIKKNRLEKDKQGVIIYE